MTANIKPLSPDLLEDYPGKGILSCEGHYKGPLELYLKSGVQIEKQYSEYFVVRKKLR
jgi:hypothetical protein